ncbi:MAG: hypothetical protein K0S08_553 [Gammaproteobacteria bacterium]|jgi:hypothetical protein|nr:hypothetical protein [Gammaproteobacteria bacterium]
MRRVTSLSLRQFIKKGPIRPFFYKLQQLFHRTLDPKTIGSTKRQDCRFGRAQRGQRPRRRMRRVTPLSLRRFTKNDRRSFLVKCAILKCERALFKIYRYLDKRKAGCLLFKFFCGFVSHLTPPLIFKPIKFSAY